MKLRLRHLTGEELQELDENWEDLPEQIWSSRPWDDGNYLLDDVIPDDLEPGITFSADNVGYGLSTGERFSEFIRKANELSAALRETLWRGIYVV